MSLVPQSLWKVVKMSLESKIYIYITRLHTSGVGHWKSLKVVISSTNRVCFMQCLSVYLSVWTTSRKNHLLNLHENFSRDVCLNRKIQLNFGRHPDQDLDLGSFTTVTCCRISCLDGGQHSPVLSSYIMNQLNNIYKINMSWYNGWLNEGR